MFVYYSMITKENIMNEQLELDLGNVSPSIDLLPLTPRQNRQIPPLKYENVYQLKKEFPDLEIVINGGIKNIEESLMHLEKVDGVMLGRAPYDNPMIVSDIDSRLFNEVNIGSDRKTILKEYLDYCKEQNNHGEPYSRTLKPVSYTHLTLPTIYSV